MNATMESAIRITDTLIVRKCEALPKIKTINCMTVIKIEEKKDTTSNSRQ